MNATEYDCEIGDVVEVFPVNGAYALPYGLNPGAQVRVVKLDQACRTVEREGREWQVYMMNVRRRQKWNWRN